MEPEDVESDEIAFTVEFSMDSDCSTCHPTPAASVNDASCVASLHAENDVSCTDCHNQEELLTQAHEGAVMGEEPMRIRTAKISDEVCLGRHESYEALAKATPDVTTLTDINGQTVNPHEAISLNEEHAEGITCLKCHSEHDAEDGQKAYEFCMNCHHSKEFECGTCHEKP